MARDTREELARELAQVKLALSNIEKQRDILPKEQFQVLVTALQTRYEALEAQILSLSGSGAIAQEGGIAAGAGGVAVGGDVVASIYVGPPPQDPTEALRAYLRLLAQTVARLPLRGVEIGAGDPARQDNLSLSGVYVSLNTTSQVRIRSQRLGDEERLRLREETRPLTALEAVSGNPRTIILGDPGSGKSTFINYLAFCLASHHLEPDVSWLERLEWPGIVGVPIPILVHLRDFASAIPVEPQRALPYHLWDFITAQLAELNVTFVAQVLQQALERGQAIVLLDGLDEVPTESMRRFVREAIIEFTNRYPGNHYVVTCRTLAYQTPAIRLPAFEAFILASFSEELVDRFIQSWYAELTRMGTVEAANAEFAATSLRHAVCRPDLWQLASNPLLLTVIALIHTHIGRLPDARALLYEETTDILLWRWEQVKAGGQEDVPGLRQLLLEAGRTDVDLKRVLWQLAFDAQTQATETTGATEIAMPHLEKALSTLHPTGSHDWARRLVRVMQERSGLLVERESDIFSFPHRMFQEYLAGAHLSVQSDFAIRSTRLAETGPQWDEIIQLAVGRLVHVAGDTHKPLALIGEMCPAQQVDDEQSWRKVRLAGEILLEIGLRRARDSGLGRDLTERLRLRLVALLGIDSLSSQERVQASQVLGDLGDPRPGVGLVDGLPDVLLVEVPAGPFVMGSDARDWSAYDDERPQHEVTVPGYKIGRFPVTNTQYAAFIEAGGYTDQTCWTPEGWAWLQEADFTQPEYWRDPQLNKPNQPVVGLSWYEATAYCRWLTNELQESGMLGPDELVRLPTEAEWEKAARGADGRVWPWGDEEDSTRCNSIEAGIGKTAAVGVFPSGASPYGVLDMVGNVWEWTNSAAASFPYNSDDGREELEGHKRRVVRGGSWRSPLTETHAASHGSHVSGTRVDDVGFRVSISAGYQIGVSRALSPVLNFFAAAGFKVRDFVGNECMLVPRDAFNRRRLGPVVYAYVEAEQIVHREDIETVVERMRTRYDNQLTDRTAFVVLERPPDYGARHQMHAYRFSDRFTMVPFSAPRLRQALQTDSCPTVLAEVLGDYLGQTDLYDSRSPVSDVLSFFGRERIIDTIRSVLDSGDHVGLFGLRKMGKTSLLNYLRDQVPYPVAVLSLQDVRKPVHIYRAAVDEWRKGLLLRFPGIPIPDLLLVRPELPSAPESAFSSDLQTILKLLENHKALPRLVLCLDEIDEIVPSDEATSGDIAVFRELMGFLRGIATRLEALNLIVCGMNPAINRVNRWQGQSNPMFQSFREIFLGPFATKEESDEMVKSIGAHMGVEYEPAALNRLYSESAGHPYITRQICSLVVAKVVERPYCINEGDIASSAEEYLRSPRTVVYLEQELWGTLGDQAEATILKALAKRQPQAEIELIPEDLPTTERLARQRALEGLSERWLIGNRDGGYSIPYGCFHRWIRLNCLESS